MTTPTDKKVPLQAIKPSYILLAAGVSCIVCFSALRANNVHMVQLREAVYAADKDNGDVSGALTNLQRYVTGHMNTYLVPNNNAVKPPIQLKYTYERLQAANASQSNSDQIYSDAQTYCEQQDSTDFSGGRRVPCIQEYVKSHNATVPKAIPDSLYKFDFVTPVWSPDLAGWTVVSTIGLLIAGVALFIVQRLAAAHHRRKAKKAKKSQS